jgi:hypothetical protein
MEDGGRRLDELVAEQLLAAFEHPTVLYRLAQLESLLEICRRPLPAPPRAVTCTELHEMGIADMGVEASLAIEGATVAPPRRRVS